MRRASFPHSAPPASAPRSTIATKNCRPRFAIRSCRKFPTWPWWAAKKPRRAAFPCGITVRATLGRSRWQNFSPSSAPKSRRAGLLKSFRRRIFLSPLLRPRFLRRARIPDDEKGIDTLGPFSADAAIGTQDRDFAFAGNPRADREREDSLLDRNSRRSDSTGFH